jgi:hypothetical protein
MRPLAGKLVSLMVGIGGNDVAGGVAPYWRPASTRLSRSAASWVVLAALEVLMEGIAKDDSSEHYTVANEYICNRAALAVGLPVPPGTIAKKADRTNMFVCLRFTAGPTSLPAVDPADLVADHPQLAAGIIAFDCWVGNWDRHAGNFAYAQGADAAVGAGTPQVHHQSTAGTWPAPPGSVRGGSAGTLEGITVSQYVAYPT